jgi:mRNA interferase MazF
MSQPDEYHEFQVVRVPFPFSDLPSVTKYRPALVVSSHSEFGAKISHSVLAMITSAKHSRFPLDTPITDHETAGLPRQCIVRMKLFTIDDRVIEAAVGRLSQHDINCLKQNFQKLFSWQ